MTGDRGNLPEINPSNVLLVSGIARSSGASQGHGPPRVCTPVIARKCLANPPLHFCCQVVLRNRTTPFPVTRIALCGWSHLVRGGQPRAGHLAEVQILVVVRNAFSYGEEISKSKLLIVTQIGFPKSRVNLHEFAGARSPARLIRRLGGASMHLLRHPCYALLAVREQVRRNGSIVCWQ